MAWILKEFRHAMTTEKYTSRQMIFENHFLFGKEIKDTVAKGKNETQTQGTILDKECLHLDGQMEFEHTIQILWGECVARYSLKSCW